MHKIPTSHNIFIRSETFYLQKPEVAVLDGLEDGLLAEVVEAGEAVTEEGVHTLDLPAEPHLGVERGHGQPVTPADAGLLLAAIMSLEIRASNRGLVRTQSCARPLLKQIYCDTMIKTGA